MSLITSTISLETFDGNGSTTTPYPLAILRDRDEDINLYVGEDPSEDFTIAPDGLRTGVAVAPGTTLTVYRITPQTQINPFPANTTPAPEDVRVALNKLTLIAQELNKVVPELGSRAICFPVNEPVGNPSQLAAAGVRAGTILGFDDITGAMILIPWAVTVAAVEAAAAAAAASASDASDDAAAAAGSAAAASSSAAAAAASKAALTFAGVDPNLSETTLTISRQPPGSNPILAVASQIYIEWQGGSATIDYTAVDDDAFATAEAVADAINLDADMIAGGWVAVWDTLDSISVTRSGSPILDAYAVLNPSSYVTDALVSEPLTSLYSGQFCIASTAVWQDVGGTWIPRQLLNGTQITKGTDGFYSFDRDGDGAAQFTPFP